MKKLVLFGMSVLLALTMACKKEEAEVEETSAKPLFKQFASGVIGFSSQYTVTPGWQATETLGEPTIYPDYGDTQGAWAPSTLDGQREYLALSFDSAHTVKKIQIYETFKPGSVDTIYLRNSETLAWNQVWYGTAAAQPDEARIFTVTIDETAYTVDAIRIAVNSPAVIEFNEIDAVAVSGTKKN